MHGREFWLLSVIPLIATAVVFAFRNFPLLSPLALAFFLFRHVPTRWACITRWTLHPPLFCYLALGIETTAFTSSTRKVVVAALRNTAEMKKGVTQRDDPKRKLKTGSRDSMEGWCISETSLGTAG